MVKHVENDKKCHFGALSKPGSIRPHPAVKDDWEWLKHHPPNAPQLLGPARRLCAPKMTRNTLSGGNYHPTSSGSFRTNAEPLAPPKHGQNEEIDEGKHLVGALKGQDRQDTRKSRKSRFYPQIMEPPHPLLANPCETPRFLAGNLSASNLTLSDAFLHHSRSTSSTFGATHCNTVYVCPQDLPTSKSTKFNAFSRVFNRILPRTGLPHLLALTPMCSDTFPLDFEPNQAILTPGTLSFHLDDESSSPFAPSMSFQPEMTLLHPRSPLASETMQSALSGGYYHLLTPPGPPGTYPEPSALTKWQNKATTASQHDGKEEYDEEKHLLGVLKEGEVPGQEKPQITDGEHEQTYIMSPTSSLCSMQTSLLQRVNDPPLPIPLANRSDMAELGHLGSSASNLMPLDHVLSLPAPCIVNCNGMGLPSPQDSPRLTLTRIASPGGASTSSTLSLTQSDASSYAVASLTLPPQQHSPQLRPLLLLQIVTARCHASCLRPLQLVQALENRLKDSTDGALRVNDPHLHNTMMTHHEPTSSNPPMVVHTH